MGFAFSWMQCVVALIFIAWLVTMFVWYMCPYNINQSFRAAEKQSVHAVTAQPVDTGGSGPIVSTDVAVMLRLLFRHFASCMDKAEIPFWLVKQSLFSAQKHGQLAPWQDIIQVAIFHEDLPKLIKLRAELEQSGRGQLHSAKHAYYFSCRGICDYPFIEINIMQARTTNSNHEIAVCTPTDELCNCSFADSYTRQHEVYTADLVLPLQTTVYEGCSVRIPANPQECLRIYINGLSDNAPGKKPMSTLNIVTAIIANNKLASCLRKAARALSNELC